MRKQIENKFTVNQRRPTDVEIREMETTIRIQVKIRAVKFILEGNKYLNPLVEGINVISLIVFCKSYDVLYNLFSCIMLFNSKFVC